MVAWISCLSHLVISYYEGSGNIKKNSMIEIIFLPFFFIILYLTILENNLLIVAFAVLFKEIILFLFRSVEIIKQVKVIRYSYLIIIFLCYLLLNSLTF